MPLLDSVYLQLAHFTPEEHQYRTCPFHEHPEYTGIQCPPGRPILFHDGVRMAKEERKIPCLLRGWMALAPS